MSIDEAIAREREIAEMHRNDIVPKEDYQNMPWIDKENELNMRSAEEHEQIAEWLEELKDYRDKNKVVVRIDCVNSDEFKDILVKTAKEQYNKAIDDFVKFASDMPMVEEEDGEYRPMRLEEMAEKLKAGGENEQSI